MAKRRRSTRAKRKPKNQSVPKLSAVEKRKAVPVSRFDDIENIIEQLERAGVDVKSAYMMRGGKPPIFVENRRVRERILSALTAGANTIVAAAFGGVSRMTLNNWIQRGKHEAVRLSDIASEGLPVTWETVDPVEAPYLDFFMATQRIRGLTAMRWVDVLASAADENPKWASYMLESQWGFGAKPQKQLIEANITGNVNVGITVDELRAAKEEVEQWENDRFGEDDADTDN